VKHVFAVLISVTSLSAFAGAPSQELAQVTRALVNNPDLVSQLKANNSANLADVKISQVRPGVIQYDLVFNRQCECVPSTASVSIVEDLTPTYADGSIEYTSSIKIKSGF
jgi:hypothetical protein